MPSLGVLAVALSLDIGWDEFLAVSGFPWPLPAAGARFLAYLVILEQPAILPINSFCVHVSMSRVSHFFFFLDYLSCFLACNLGLESRIK